MSAWNSFPESECSTHTFALHVHTVSVRLAVQRRHECQQCQCCTLSLRVSTTYIGPIIGLVDWSYHRLSRQVVPSTKWIGRTIDQVHTIGQVNGSSTKWIDRTRGVPSTKFIPSAESMGHRPSGLVPSTKSVARNMGRANGSYHRLSRLIIPSAESVLSTDTAVNKHC
jgi:hypothetical protein